MPTAGSKSGASRRLIPLFDRLLVSRAVAEKKTASGIILTDAAAGTQNYGTVVAAGPGRTTDSGSVIEMSVKVGDEVLLPEFGGAKVELDGEEFVLFRESEVMGVFSK